MTIRNKSVRFAYPAVQSVSRRPLPQELLHMNLLEEHVERCILCEPEIGGQIPLFCRSGRQLRSLIQRTFMIFEDGLIYSTSDEYGPAIRVEISIHYCTVLRILVQNQLDHIRHSKRC
jgi:hypothetical protein